MAHWAGSNLTNGTSTQLGRAFGGGPLGAGAGFPAGDGLDGLAAVSRHQVDDSVHVTRLEQVHHLLVVMARLVDIYKAGKSIRRGNIPQIGEEAHQPVTSGPAEGDEMKLAIKIQVFSALPRCGQLPHLAAQPAHFLKIVTCELGDGHEECLPLEYLPPVVNIGEVIRRQDPDEEADPRPVLEISGRGQRGERLAHRYVRYAQISRDRAG